MGIKDRYNSWGEPREIDAFLCLAAYSDSKTSAVPLSGAAEVFVS